MKQRQAYRVARAIARQLAGACFAASLLGSVAKADEPGEPARTHAPRHAPGHAPERPVSLRIATLGGGVQDAQQTALFAPFTEQTGMRLRIFDWDDSLATLRSRAQTGHEDWDLVLMDAAALQVACREGLLLSAPLRLDPAKAAPDSSGTACGVPAWRMNLVLAWDRSRVDITPTWNDFWNVAQHPGKRGLRRGPRGTLEIALMADGVAPGDVYRTLATSEGVDRAFHKLDQLKPYIVWWNTPAEAVQIIESGAVLMTSAPDGEVAAAENAGHRSFGAQWTQSLGIDMEWGMPSGAMPGGAQPERRALAQKLLAFISDTARRDGFFSAYGATPQPPGTAAPQATLNMDDRFWLDHLVPLQRRFERWLEAR